MVLVSSLPPSALALKLANFVPPHIFLPNIELLSAPALKLSVNEFMYWKFKDSVSQSPAALCLSDIQLPLLFTARYCGDSSFWRRCPGLGSLAWDWEPPILRGTSSSKISILFHICHTMLWDLPILHLCPS